MTENGLAAVLVVTRTGSLAGAVSVDYATSDGSAQAGVNYTAQAGTLTFSAGQASQTVTIPIQDDGLADGNKSFDLSLSNPSGVNLGSVSQALVTIDDSGSAGQIQFASAAATFDRHDGGLVLTVTRTGGSHGIVRVDYRVTGGTAVPLYLLPGTGDEDYVDNFGTVTNGTS